MYFCTFSYGIANTLVRFSSDEINWLIITKKMCHRFEQGARDRFDRDRLLVADAHGVSLVQTTQGN